MDLKNLSEGVVDYFISFVPVTISIIVQHHLLLLLLFSVLLLPSLMLYCFSFQQSDSQTPQALIGIILFDADLSVYGVEGGGGDMGSRLLCTISFS